MLSVGKATVVAIFAIAILKVLAKQGLEVGALAASAASVLGMHAAAAATAHVARAAAIALAVIPAIMVVHVAAAASDWEATTSERRRASHLVWLSV